MGADKTISVDFSDTHNAREKFEAALQAFREIKEEGFSKELEMLDGMNSDYTSKLKTVLEKFDFTSFDSLILKYEELVEKEKNAADELQDLDKNLSEQFSS